MEEARVLILELGLVSGLASTLREMLETAAAGSLIRRRVSVSRSSGTLSTTLPNLSDSDVEA
jgi:hypothetical protein